MPLPRHGRGILFPHRWPVLLRAAKGRVPLKGRMFGCRLAGCYNLTRTDSATRLCCFRGSLQWSSETGWPSLLRPGTAVSMHCLFPFYVLSIFIEKTPLLLFMPICVAYIFFPFSPLLVYVFYQPNTMKTALATSGKVVLVSVELSVLTVEKTISSEIHCCFCAPYSISLSSLWE